jgi:hypothetical protein
MHSMSISELRQLPAIVDLVTAGRALGLGRTKAYELARRGEFPCHLFRIGDTYRVPTAALLKLLEVPETGPALLLPGEQAS